MTYRTGQIYWDKRKAYYVTVRKVIYLGFFVRVNLSGEWLTERKIRKYFTLERDVKSVKYLNRKGSSSLTSLSSILHAIIAAPGIIGPCILMGLLGALVVITIFLA